MANKLTKAGLGAGLFSMAVLMFAFLSGGEEPDLGTDAVEKGTAVEEQAQPDVIGTIDDLFFEEEEEKETPVIPTRLPLPTTEVAPDPLAIPKIPSANCSANIYNCGDFNSCSEVMSVFNQCPNDPNDLDRDSDGIPCESLCG